MQSTDFVQWVVILKKTRELISDRKHWVQDYAAIDNAGNPINPQSPNACAWCLDGALVRCSIKRRHYDRITPYLHSASMRLFNINSYVAINDGWPFSPPENAHANVLRILDDAIELMERL